MALNAIKVEKTLAELTKVHNVHARQTVDWKSQLLDRAAFVFGAQSASPPTVNLKGLHAKYGQPEIFNTNQGSQFTSGGFTGALKAGDVQISMDGKGASRNNAFFERL